MTSILRVVYLLTVQSLHKGPYWLLYVSSESICNPVINTKRSLSKTPKAIFQLFAGVRVKSNTSCSRGWRQSNDLCFYLSDVKLKVSFSAAVTLCAQLGAKLAEFLTKNDYTFVKKQLHDGTDSIDAWFGLRKSINATKYTYLSDNSEPNYNSLGVEFIAPTITNRQSENCVTMLLTKQKATWEVERCDQKLNSYVCQTGSKRGKKYFNIVWSCR